MFLFGQVVLFARLPHKVGQTSIDIIRMVSSATSWLLLLEIIIGLVPEWVIVGRLLLTSAAVFLVVGVQSEHLFSLHAGQ